MRPLAVLILVLGAASALLFAFLSLSPSGPPKSVVAGPTVKPAEVGNARPTAIIKLDEPAPAGTEVLPSPGSATTRKGVEGAIGASFTNAIAGSIVDEQGNPIKNARIELGPANAMSEIGHIARIMSETPTDVAVRVFTTSKTGEFQFRNLEPGKFGFIVSHEEYARRRIMDLDVGEETQIIETVTLKKGRSLSGYVRDADTGTPIEGATIVLDTAMALMLQRPSGSAREAKSGLDGYYEFPNIARENLAIYCAAKGYGSQIHGNMALSLGGKPGKNESKEKNFELEVGQIIAGRVIGPDLTGIEGAKIVARRHNSEYTSLCEGVSRSDGEFLIEGLASGTYTLSPTLPDGWEADTLQKIEAGSTNVEIKAFEQGRVAGRVIHGKTGVGIKNFRLRLRLIHPTTQTYGSVISQKQVRNAKNGEFEIGGVSENTYVVQADAKGFASSFSKSFQVTQGMTQADIVVRMTQGGTLTGMVLDSYTGKPIAGAKVSTHENRWIDSPFTDLLGGKNMSALSQTATRTNDKGEFEFKLLTPGSYQIRIEHREYTRQTHDEVHMGDEAELTIGPYLLAHGATVTGTVYGKDGKPGAGMRVYLRPIDGAIGGGGQARTNSAGFFTLKNVAAGNYKLSASRSQEELTGSPFDTILDMKNSETEISLLDGRSYSNDLHLGPN